MPGSWGTHSNSCAEDVIAVLKLSPEVGVNKKKVVDVYPDSRQDRLYSELLNYKRELSGNYDFLNFIFEVAQ